MVKHVRYKIDSKGNPCQWFCWAGQNEEGVWGMFSTDGRVNVTDEDEFKMKDPTFKASKEKNIGKGNYMNFENQAFAMVEQSIGKKERANYFSSIEEAIKLKKFMPMLADKWKLRKGKLVYPVASQPKLDGARCNVYWCSIEGKVVARTRTSKDYSAVVDHIVDELRDLCEEDKSLIFDGELYNHDLKHDFERIMSLTRQSKPTPEDLKNAVSMIQFHVYDVYSADFPSSPFSEREFIRTTVFEEYVFRSCKFVETTQCDNEEDVNTVMDNYLYKGYEGQMVRVYNSVYKPNGRSQDLLKNKVFTDEEFEIVDMEEGQGDWVGAVKRLFIKLPDGRIQRCGIDGSYKLNSERLKNKKDFIGKLATVRYFRHTSDGLLYIPVAKELDRFDHVDTH
tara:strand:+ start:8056 stop:9237 length:1182 start_codon:yes stop_codon:yes gene_type:complete